MFDLRLLIIRYGQCSMTIICHSVPCRLAKCRPTVIFVQVQTLKNLMLPFLALSKNILMTFLSLYLVLYFLFNLYLTLSTFLPFCLFSIHPFSPPTCNYSIFVYKSICMIYYITATSKPNLQIHNHLWDTILVHIFI